jgi:hypothetical protein
VAGFYRRIFTLPISARVLTLRCPTKPLIVRLGDQSLTYDFDRWEKSTTAAQPGSAKE